MTVLRALGAVALTLGVLAGVVSVILHATRDPEGLAPVLAVGAGAFVMVASGAAMLGRAGFLDRRMARRSIRWPLRW